VKHLTMRRKKNQDTPAVSQGEHMGEPQSRNDKWRQILDAADTGIISPRDAIMGAQEHYEGVYGNNFAAAVTMLEQQAQTLETLARSVEAERKDDALILSILQREEERHKEQQRIDAARHADETRQRETADANLRAYFHRELSNVAEAINERLDGQDQRITQVEDGLTQGQARIMDKIVELDARQRADEERIRIDEARLDAKRTRIEALEEADRRRHTADAARDAEIARIAAALAARPSPEEARQTYEGVQEIPAIREALARIEEELKRGNGSQTT
jgi:hypothetical protein